MSRPVTRLATGGQHGSVSIWDPTNGSLLCRSIGEQEGTVMGVAWSPAGDFLASCSTSYSTGGLWLPFDNDGEGNKVRCGSVKLWDTSNDSMMPLAKDVVSCSRDCPSFCVAFRPELKHEGVDDTGQVLLLASGLGAKVRLDKIHAEGRTVTSTKVGELERHRDLVTCMAWTPDGATLVTGSEDCSIVLWQVQRDLSSVESTKTLTYAHANPVSSLACTHRRSDGMILVSADLAGHFTFIDPFKAEVDEISTIHGGKKPRVLELHDGRLGVLVLPDAGMCSVEVKSGDRRMEGRALLNLETGKLGIVARLGRKGDFKFEGSYDWTKPRKLINVVAPGGLELIANKVVNEQDAANEAVQQNRRDVAADGDSEGQQVEVVIHESGSKTACLGTSVSISPDGTTLVASIDGEIVLWDIDSGGAIRRKLPPVIDKGVLLWSFATDWHSRAKELNALQRLIIGGRFTAAEVRELLNDGGVELASSKDNMDRLPLHLVLQPRSAPTGDDDKTSHQTEEEAAGDLLHVVEMLLEAFPAAVKTADPETAELPLHLAARNPRAWADLFKRLLNEYPEAAAREGGEDGLLPLHTLLKHRGAGEDRAAALVGQLLAANPAAAAVPFPEAQMNGWLPARLAVNTRATGDVLRLLLEEYPEAAEQPVATGSSQYLLHEALQKRPVVVDAVQVLLEFGPRHTIFQVILTHDDLLVDAVARAVSNRPELAWAVHETRKVRAIDAASIEYRIAMRKALLFLGRYDINSGPAAHISATCVVLFAEDSDMRGGSGQKVALKLMRSKSQFLNEIRCRDGLTSDRVVHYLRLHINSDALLNDLLPVSVIREKRPVRDSLRLALQLKAEELRASQPPTSGGTLEVDGSEESDSSMIGVNYKKWLDSNNPDHLEKEEELGNEVYCFVMPCADRNLSAAITHERFAGRGSELDTIRLIASHLAKALWDMHDSMQLVHCDVKPLNIVRVGHKWCLIDLDVSCKAENKFGSKKPSTGYCPPELAALLLKGEHREYVADVACDMWAFGCVLFHLCTSETLWHTDQDDNIKEQDLELVAELGERHGNINVLERRLQLVGQRLGANEKHKRQADLALNLLWQLFTPTQKGRLRHCHSFEKILMHPFLTGQEEKEVVSTTNKEILSELSKLRSEQEKYGGIIRNNHNLLCDMEDNMGVMLRAMRMQCHMLMELLLEEESCPSLAVFLPPRPRGGPHRQALPEWVANPRMLFAHEVRLYFVCSVSMEVAQTNKGKGFPITIKREWLSKAAPYLRIGLMVMKTAVASSRFAGIPIPGLEDGIVKILDAMKSVVNEELKKCEIDGERMDKLFDKIKQDASKQASKDGSGSSRGTTSILGASSATVQALKNKIKQSTQFLDELLADQRNWRARSGLKKVVCSDGEQVIHWCLPKYAPLINRKSKAVVAQIRNGAPAVATAEEPASPVIGPRPAWVEQKDAPPSTDSITANCCGSQCNMQ